MATVRLKIRRGSPAGGAELAEYEVPYSEGMSLLDAVLWIREHQDPSLAVRYSCRISNACKECSAAIDGKAGYLCNTRAVPGQTVTLEPLGKRGWIQDLVSQMD